MIRIIVKPGKKKISNGISNKHRDTNRREDVRLANKSQITRKCILKCM